MSLRAKMLAVMADINGHIAERKQLVELIAIALLTRKNLFVLGEPGQAKSYAINLFRDRIVGCHQFERLLSKQSDEEQLFGRIDLQTLIPGAVSQDVLRGDATYCNMAETLDKLHQQLLAQPKDSNTMALAQSHSKQMENYKNLLSLLHQGQPKLITTGKIPEAHIVFLDEIFKCNDGVLNALLTVLNERKYTNEGQSYPIPTISFFAAANEIPNFNDPSEKILEALYDRLELKLVTENIEDRNNRLSMMATKQTGGIATTKATITLEELVAMEQEVASIPVPAAINELADDVCCELRRAGIKISDRKLLNYGPIAQAKAWLEGHATVTTTDLLALSAYLWQKPADCATVDNVLQRLCVNPLQDKINTIRGMAAETKEQFDEALTADAQDRKHGGKVLAKFRSEFVRLYRQIKDLQKNLQTKTEETLVDNLLADLEKISLDAHTAVKFTYTTLDQIDLMQ